MYHVDKSHNTPYSLCLSVSVTHPRTLAVDLLEPYIFSLFLPLVTTSPSVLIVIVTINLAKNST